MSNLKLNACPDCGVEAGQAHKNGCDMDLNQFYASGVYKRFFIKPKS